MIHIFYDWKESEIVFRRRKRNSFINEYIYKCSICPYDEGSRKSIHMMNGIKTLMPRCRFKLPSQVFPLMLSYLHMDRAYSQGTMKIIIENEHIHNSRWLFVFDEFVQWLAVERIENIMEFFVLFFLDHSTNRGFLTSLF